MASKRRNKTVSSNSPSVENDDFMRNFITEMVKANVMAQQLGPKISKDISKAWKQIPNADSQRAPKSWYVDPFNLQYSLGYRERRNSLSFPIIRQIFEQLTVLNSILQVRCAQVAAFAEPYRHSRGLGFVIKHKDDSHATTNAEVQFIKELEQFVLNCGHSRPNHFSRVKRDGLDVFLRKIVRDSLQLDAVAIEKVPDNLGRPYEFIAVDASTIRLAEATGTWSINQSYDDRPPPVLNGPPPRFSSLYTGRSYGDDGEEGRPIEFVQVINGMIENVYSEDDLIYAVRNPTTNIYKYSYGTSEIEMALPMITGLLFAEQYNRNLFTNGSLPLGIFNVKSEDMDPIMYEEFKRQWNAQGQGVENAHRTLFMNSAQGVEWTPLKQSNRDQEFSNWTDYLVKNICAVYLVDPSELGYYLNNNNSQTPLFESSNEWKIKASKDKGLKPLLKFIANIINKHIIDEIDDHFKLEFVGLDEPSEKERREAMIEELTSYKTLNEVRKAQDLPPLPYGDVPMNPTYLQAQAQLSQQEKEEEQTQEVPTEDGSMQDPGEMSPEDPSLSKTSEEEPLNEEPQGPPVEENIPSEDEQEFEMPNYGNLVGKLR